MAEMKMREPPSPCEYLPLKDVARILGVGPAWVYGRLGTTELPPHVRLGKLIKFPKEQFLRWRKQIGESHNV